MAIVERSTERMPRFLPRLRSKCAFGLSPAGTSARGEGDRHLLPGADAAFARPATVDLEHEERGASYRSRRVREWSGAFGDADDGPILVDEEHVERNAGVVHPEGVVAPAVEPEEHPRVLRH